MKKLEKGERDMEGCVHMVRMNYSDQINAITKVFEERTRQLKAMPDDEAKVVARKNLVEVGLIDESGNLTAPYVAMRERYGYVQQKN